MTDSKKNCTNCVNSNSRNTPPISKETNKDLIVESGRLKIKDKIFTEDFIAQEKNWYFHNKYLIRVSGKKKKLEKINFSHSHFENCYFRSMVFDSCDFTGCKFINCNFKGSSFPDSNFEYATFEKTFIESSILDENCPKYNNLASDFAQTLRMNYQEIGDKKSVKKAVRLELSATEKYLKEAWYSNYDYHRKKYQGRKRLEMFLEWLGFKMNDFMWGNGESLRKLTRLGLICLLVISIIDTMYRKNPDSVSDYFFSSISSAPAIFMGIDKPQIYSNTYLTFISAIRYVGFALLTSLLIKKFSRR